MPSRREKRKPHEAGSRERMIQTMGDLLRRRGYAATGLQQLTEEARAPIGSMYFHFPGGKEQLAAEAVTRAGSERSAVLATLLGGTNTADAVRAIAAAMGRDLVTSRWHNGCPIATPALEMSGESEPIRAAANASFDAWELLFAQRLGADGVPSGRARAIAAAIVAALEGGLILARTRRSLAPLEAIAALLASWISAEARPPASAAASTRARRRREPR